MMPARRRSWFLYTLLFVFVLGMSAMRWRLPAYAATFEVTSTNDSGTGTLRAAIESANTTPGADIITFDLPTGSEINLTNPLPLVVDTLTIDGGGRDITISPPVGRALVITQGDVVIQDVTFARGGAAIRHESSGTLGIDNVRFENLVGGDGSAVLVTTSSVSLNDVTVSGISAAGSAIQIRGDATVSAVSNLVIEGNRLSNAALLFDTTAAGTIALDSVAVRANEGVAQVRVQAGDVALTNSVITGGVNATHGLRVNSGGTATLSFVTITGNGGNGISNAGTVNAQNTASAGNTNPGCTGGGTFSLTGRNFIDGSGCGDPVFPSLLAPKLNPDTGRPAADSPLIDRAEASCSAYGGGAVSTSFDGVARPARATCDIGAFEVPAGTVSGGQLDLTSLNGPGLNGGALLQEGGPSATVSGIRLDTFPIVPVSFELTADAQCQLLDGGGTPVSSITLTFNGNNWSNGRSFSVQAVDDTVGEGNHTCEVTAAYVTGSPADPLYANTAASQTIAVGLADDPADLTETPVVQFNFCEIENSVTPSANVVDCSTLSPAPTPEFLKEGELSSVGLPVRITLAEPPTAPVRVWVTSNAPAQCQSSANTSSSLNTLTVETWDEGIVIDVYAVEDGEKEYSQSNCPVTGNWEYDASVSTPGDNTSAQTLLIEADDLTSLERSPVGDINLDEGERETVNIRTDYEIAGSAPDSYTVTLTDTLGDLNTSECQLFDADTGNALPVSGGQATITLDASNDGSFDVEILAIAEDEFESDPQQCSIQAAVDPAASNLATDGVPLTINVNIPQDPLTGTEAEVIVRDGDTLDVIPNGSLQFVTLAEGDGNELRLSLDVAVTDAVPVRLETAPRPFTVGPYTTDIPQCLVSAGSSTGTSIPVNLTGTDEVSVSYQAAEDPLIAEIANVCIVRLVRTDRNETLVEFFVDIVETTGNRISVLDFEEPPFIENENTTGGELFFVLPQPLDTDAVIRLNYSNSSCRLVIGSTALVDGAELTLFSAPLTVDNFYGPFSVQARGVNGDQICEIQTTFLQVPTAYTGVEFPDIDVTIVDVDGRPPDNDDDPDDGDPPSVIVDPQQGEEVVTPTPVGTPVPNPIPTDVPLPSVSAVEGTGRIPVRTGPYLGATFVTIALPEDEGGETNFYRVLARNNDEREDITWFKVVVNGRIGWMSGVSLELNNITLEELPVEGSVFDQIEDAPDLGVQGTLLKDRAVHRRPSSRAAVTGGVIPAGSVVSIIGVTREFPYNDWYQIRFGGVTGWIATDEQLEDDPAVDVNRDAVREIVPVR